MESIPLDQLGNVLREMGYKFNKQEIVSILFQLNPIHGNVIRKAELTRYLQKSSNTTFGKKLQRDEEGVGKVMQHQMNRIVLNVGKVKKVNPYEVQNQNLKMEIRKQLIRLPPKIGLRLKMDLENRNEEEVEVFYEILKQHGIEKVELEDLILLEKGFGFPKGTMLNGEMLVKWLFPKWNDTRLNAVRAVYDGLTTEEKENNNQEDWVLDAADMYDRYRYRQHPKVKRGEWIQDMALIEFVQEMEMVCRIKGCVRWKEFMDYYQISSLYFDEDDAFMAYLDNLWNSNEIQVEKQQINGNVPRDAGKNTLYGTSLHGTYAKKNAGATVYTKKNAGATEYAKNYGRKCAIWRTNDTTGSLLADAVIVEKTKYTQPENGLVPPGIDSIILQVQRLVQDGGEYKMVQVVEELKTQANQIGGIHLKGFKEAMKIAKIDIPEKDLRIFFEYFKPIADIVQVGLLIQAFCGKCSQLRSKWISDAFKCLNEKNNRGVLEVLHIVESMNAKVHPHVIVGQITEQECLARFKLLFKGRTMMTRAEFTEIYKMISVAVKSDSYFETITKLWTTEEVPIITIPQVVSKVVVPTPQIKKTPKRYSNTSRRHVPSKTIWR